MKKAIIVVLSAAALIAAMSPSAQAAPDNATKATATSVPQRATAASVNAATRDCLAGVLEKVASRGGVDQMVRENAVVGFDKSRLVYWPSEQTALERNAAVACPSDPGLKGTYAYLNVAATAYIRKQGVYVPSRKGDLESTAAYTARIQGEKLDFESKAKTSDFPKTLDLAWATLVNPAKIYMGNLRFKAGGGYADEQDPKNPVYDPDAGTYQILIYDPQSSIRIPLTFTLPVEQVQALLSVQHIHYPAGLTAAGISELQPTLAMELVGSHLIIRSLTLKSPYEDVRKAMDEKGINVRDIPVNYEIPYDFGM